MKKHFYEIRKVVRSEGANVQQLIQGKNHLCVVIRTGAGTAKIYTGLTPSDQRWIRNFRNDVRNMIKRRQSDTSC